MEYSVDIDECFSFSFRYEVPTSSHEDPATALVAVYLREKKSSLTYSPSNLFGQPLLIGVPREGTNYEKLYDVVLSSLSRYVTPPPPLVEGETPMPEQEWWKPAPAATPQVLS